MAISRRIGVSAIANTIIPPTASEAPTQPVEVRLRWRRRRVTRRGVGDVEGGVVEGGSEGWLIRPIPVWTAGAWIRNDSKSQRGPLVIDGSGAAGPSCRTSVLSTVFVSSNRTRPVRRGFSMTYSVATGQWWMRTE